MSHDTIIHRIVRPAVRRVALTGVTPNQITTLRLLGGIAAALAFAGPSPWPAIGGGIFLFSMLLDRADGELARQTRQFSAGGHRYDLISDCSSGIIAFIGIGVGLMPILDLTGPLLGVVAGLGIGALFWQLNVLKLGELRGYQIAPGLTVDPDDAMVFVPVLVWLGLSEPMLWAAAVITPLAALWLGLTGRRRDRIAS
ncbi:CDP-alcohol phosphatidyltransferase family protein [Roseomonas mucosa]|uniref:CDP-alcohol phosphatidyltransferase family protein n=1 Tax=Roseomonas mucosa TaxID=207340 RepID=UPI0028CBC894|nr:CDP-alcohol phosphatidyltransferase family protein [Roseomonas mucosa]MDT8277174.1 CDP-alcohol phosphatidyltransferase family protein [Roseomonas mucosa]